MSITATTTTTTTTAADSSSNKRLPLTDGTHHHPSTSFSTEHFVNERYPKTYLEEIPSVILQYPPPNLGNQWTRSRHSLRFRTQPVTLTEINETDEEIKIENPNPQESQIKLLGDFHRLDHLTLSENIRRSARKKAPLKNYLERQRLIAMREEACETDGN